MPHYPNYHDTGFEPNIEAREKKATKQNGTILEFMQEHPGQWFTPYEVHRCLVLNLNGPPLTSIRRSLTTLTAKGKLIKSQNRVPGERGALNFRWTAKN